MIGRGYHQDVRSYSFRNGPLTSRRTIHHPWEADLLRAIPPILGEDISVRCSYQDHPPQTFTLHRYDRTDEVLAALPPRVRVPFDLFWGITTGERLSHAQIAAQLKKKRQCIAHTVTEAYSTTRTKYARPVDVVNT